MPLKTFENLEEKRQQEILDVAYEEFALHSYNTASVSNIVKKLGIAKGSFYRYFKNKLDLYAYLIDHAYKIRMSQLDGLLINPDLNFFDIIKENFRNKIEFDIRYPLQSSFMYNVMIESNYNRDVYALAEKLKTTVINFTQNIIAQYQKAGKINLNINPQKAAFLIYQVQVGIYEYLSLFKNIDFSENIKNKKAVFTLPETEIMKIVEDFTEIIKSGLEQKE